MPELDGDRLVRKPLERELRRINRNGPDRLLAAWAVDLLSLRINDVEVADRERGKQWLRAIGALAGNAPTGLGLSTDYLVLRTPRRYYWSLAGLVYLARSSERVVELAWVIQRPEDGSIAAAAIPASPVDLGSIVLNAARIDAFSTERAARIVSAIIERRGAHLALLDAETRAATEGIIQEWASVSLH